MAIDFKYYLRGSHIALVERSSTTNEYTSPTKNITNGLMLEYSKQPSAPTNEDSVLDITEELSLAAVEYVKAKFAENEQQYDKRNFHMNEFKRMVFQYQRNRFGGVRKTMQQTPFALR
mgnify:CR=1 FL=1|tara:strand:- start:2048 stop:2401 length:354 start_codon:yes stop_codon:yes gene_type:complete